MEIKETKDIFIYKKLPLIFFLCSAATIVLRTVQIFKFTDRETGFTTGGDILNIAVYLIIAVTAVLFMLTAFLSKETEKVSLRLKKDNLVSVASLFLAMSFLYDSVSAFFGSFETLDASAYGVSAFRSMMLSGTIPQFFQSLFALLSAFYFFSFAKGIIKETYSAEKHRILAVAPVCWAGFRLIYRFVEQISYVRVSELLIELVLLAFLVLFFMAFAQVSSGVYVKNARWRIIGLGLSSAMMSLTLNIPRFAFVLLKGADELYSKYPFRVCDFVIAVFIVIVSLRIIKGEIQPDEA